MCFGKPISVAVTPAQQRVLERIAVQRERFRARHAARRQAPTPMQGANTGVESGASSGASLYPPDASFAERLALFARAHPAFAGAVAAALVAAAGPRRVLRWATIALPWILRLRG